MSVPMLPEKRGGPLSLSIASEIDGAPFGFTETSFEKHLAVLGGTGTGKSKFLELLMRHFLVGGNKRQLDFRGFCLIDPHGDLSEDILAFAERRRIDLRTDAILKRIHYLEPSYDALFGYDPFQFSPATPIPTELRENAYRAWLHTKVDRVSEIIQRKQGQTDFEGMPRLQRVLRDVLYAVGIAVDAKGKHLPMSDALVLLNPDHERYPDVFRVVSKHLPNEIAADLNRLNSYKRVEDRLKETESTINRLRSFLSPIVEAIFSRRENTIDFRQIMQQRGILLVNLRETDYFSFDQANALGGLFIHQILSAAATTDRERRVPYYLIVDEAARFIGDDLNRALGECRKYKLSVVLAAQDLSSFQKKDLDMTRKVLSQCRSQVCFQQQHPDDLELLAKVLCYGNLDFTPLLEVKDRPDGFDFRELHGGSDTRTTGSNWSNSESAGESDGKSDQITNSNSSQSNWHEGPSGPGHGSARSTGGGTGASLARSSGGSHVDTRSNSHSAGGSESESSSTSWRTVPLAKQREEWHETGRLRRSVDDQFQKIMQQLYSLPTQCAFVKLVDHPRAFPVKFADVAEPFPTQRLKFRAIEIIKRKLQETHPYYFRPDFGPGEQERRIANFLRETGAFEWQRGTGDAVDAAEDYG